MPDIRLRPATTVPSDIALDPNSESRVDIRLAPAPGSDIMLSATGLPVVPVAAGGAEAHSGIGTLALSATFATTGQRTGAGTGTFAATYSQAQTSRKGALGDTSDPPIALTLAFSASTRMDAVGAGTLVSTLAFVSSATTARPGTGTLAPSLSLAASGVMGGQGTGTLAASAGFTSTFTSGTLVPAPAVPIRRWPMQRPEAPPFRMGHGTIELDAQLWAVGYKSSESDDELVLALAA